MYVGKDVSCFVLVLVRVQVFVCWSVGCRYVVRFCIVRVRVWLVRVFCLVGMLCGGWS